MEKTSPFQRVPEKIQELYYKSPNFGLVLILVFTIGFCMGMVWTGGWDLRLEKVDDKIPKIYFHIKNVLLGRESRIEEQSARIDMLFELENSRIKMLTWGMN